MGDISGKAVVGLRKRLDQENVWNTKSRKYAKSAKREDREVGNAQQGALRAFVYLRGFVVQRLFVPSRFVPSRLFVSS